MAKTKYDENTIIVKDKIYIPKESGLIDVEEIEDKYSHWMYDEKACRRCPVRPERHNFECDQCPAYKGTVVTSNEVYKNGIEYIGLPLGDRDCLDKKFGIDLSQFNVIDKRVRPKFDYNVKMSKKFQLRDYQEEAEEIFWDHKYGIIVAPPRSGKTPLILHIAVRLGLRTILLANQHEFLKQFLDHVEEFTNLPLLQEKYDKKLYGFPKSEEDFDTFQIAVCTYQQFLSEKKGKERYAQASRNYGTLMVDESHKAAANGFASVLNSSPARVRLAVTGTDKRKDGRHKILRDIIGPVVKRVSIPQLQAKIIVHLCDYVKSRSQFKGPAGFTYCTQFLGKHEKRNNEILENVLKDLAKGHSIVIPMLYRGQVTDMVNWINALAGAGTAEGFMGGAGKKNKALREGIIDRAREGKTRVVVGIRSIIQLGINIPLWSCLYYIMPMNNEPNWKQESSRILTPLEGKRTPIIRMFVDPHIPLSRGCFVNTFKQAISFGHAPTAKARERANEVFEIHSGRSYDDEMLPLDDSIDQAMFEGQRKKKRSRPSKGFGVG